MTISAASRLAAVTSLMMLPLLVIVGLRSREVTALAMPATVVVLTVGVEMRIARALRGVPEDQRGNELPALLIHLLLLIPCIGLAGLLAALD
jgi:hypothetical protein